MSKKVQFCVKTLKFYQVNNGERDYSIHEDTLQTKVDDDLAIGNERREDPEIRLIKFLIGRSVITKKNKKKLKKPKVIFNEPKWIQQVLREFPNLVQKIHHIQLSGAQEGNLKQISQSVLNDFFNHTTAFLIETGNEDHAKLVIKLTEIFNNLEWREVRKTSQATTKTDRITNFLSRDIKHLL